MERIGMDSLDPTNWKPMPDDSGNSKSSGLPTRRALAAEALIIKMWTAASQAAPMGEAMAEIVQTALELWKAIPDDRLKEFAEKAMVRAAPYAATIAQVAKLYQERNRDSNGMPVHDELAAVRHHNASMASISRPRIADDGGKPISAMPRAEYLRQCANLYRIAGLPVPPHLQELELPQTVITPSTKSG